MPRKREYNPRADRRDYYLSGRPVEKAPPKFRAGRIRGPLWRKAIPDAQSRGHNPKSKACDTQLQCMTCGRMLMVFYGDPYHMVDVIEPYAAQCTGQWADDSLIGRVPVHAELTHAVQQWCEQQMDPQHRPKHFDATTPDVLLD